MSRPTRSQLWNAIGQKAEEKARERTYFMFTKHGDYEITGLTEILDKSSDAEVYYYKCTVSRSCVIPSNSVLLSSRIPRNLFIKTYSQAWTMENEIKAYHRLEELQGSVIPRLLGSIQQCDQEEYALAFEYLPGSNLSSDSCERSRIAALEKALQADFLRLSEHGVCQYDPACRNVMIVPLRGWIYFWIVPRLLIKSNVGNIIVTKVSYMLILLAIASIAIAAITNSHLVRWTCFIALGFSARNPPFAVGRVVLVDFSHAEFNLETCAALNAADVGDIIEQFNSCMRVL